MNRPDNSCIRAVLCLSLLGIIDGSADATAAERSRPNVLLIVADDLGWADLTCYGSSFHRTPHIDELATQGVRFTQAYAASPVCSPSRAAILTGRWPARLQVTDWLPGRGNRPDQKLNHPPLARGLNLDEITIAERLHDLGYATATIGKWHLGGADLSPTHQGFDLNIAGDDAGSPLRYFAPFSAGDRKLLGLDQAPAGQYLTDALTDSALQFLEAHARHPFLLYLPHFAVHTPLAAPEDRIAHYPAEQPFAGKQNNPVYAAMLESLDTSVGRITKKLRELNIFDDTVIIFTSDNGGLATQEGPHTPATSNAPLRDGKGYLYEGGIRVPLIIKGGHRIGAVESNPVCGIDLAATISEFCGDTTAPVGDGLSLKPLLENSASLPREALYWHYPHYSNQGGRPGGAIRVGDYKLIEYFEHGRQEMFQLVRDPSESQNLIEQEPDVAQKLAERLAEWRKLVNAPLPTANPDYLPNPGIQEGPIELHARTATVHGVMLRFEPLPHKDTLGFWVRAEDWASWEFTVSKPGRFEVEVWQGCGNGSGGSLVEFSCNEQTLSMEVEETGGFQNFRARTIGELRLAKPGRYELQVRPRSKPGVAVMDVRRIVLRSSPP